MKDERGGWKAPDTALWREHLHAATMAGRVAAARVAVELGYAIEPDPGPSGRLGHWKIAGVPDEVMELHSKRAAEIEAECQRRGESCLTGPRRGRPCHPARPSATSRSGRPYRAAGERNWPSRGLAGASAWPPRSTPRRAPGEPRTAHACKQARAILLRRCWAATGIWPGARFSPAATLIVALAPQLSARPRGARTGWSTGALADPEVVPLVGVAGARETSALAAPRCWPGRPPSPRACGPPARPGPTTRLCRPAYPVEQGIEKTEQGSAPGCRQEQRAAAVADLHFGARRRSWW